MTPPRPSPVPEERAVQLTPSLRVAHLEAEREKLLARLAYLRAEARSGGRGKVLSRERAEELHGLLSAVWLELNALHPARVPELDRALRILEEALEGFK